MMHLALGATLLVASQGDSDALAQEIERREAAGRAAEQQAVRLANEGRLCEAAASFLSANLSAPRSGTVRNAALAAEAAGDLKTARKLFALAGDDDKAASLKKKKGTHRCDLDEALLPPDGNWPAIEVTVGCQAVRDLLTTHQRVPDDALVRDAAERARAFDAHGLQAKLLAVVGPDTALAAAQALLDEKGPGPSCSLDESLLPKALTTPETTAETTSESNTSTNTAEETSAGTPVEETEGEGSTTGLVLSGVGIGAAALGLAVGLGTIGTLGFFEWQLGLVPGDVGIKDFAIAAGPGIAVGGGIATAVLLGAGGVTALAGMIE